MRTQTRICSCDCTRRLLPRLRPSDSRGPLFGIDDFFLRGYRDLESVLTTLSHVRFLGEADISRRLPTIAIYEYVF